MATSAAISGLGVTLKRGDGASSEAFAALAELVDIAGPNMSRDVIDVTNHDNNASGFREFLGGLKDGGEITLTVQFTYAGYNTAFTDFASDDTVNYQLVAPDTGETTWNLTALITSLNTTFPLNDKVTHEMTLKLSGQPTLEA